MAVDARGQLAEDPFEYQVAKSGQVMISRGGRQVAVVGGARAARLVAVLAGLAAASDETAIQLALAKVTGNYKRGNERRR